MEKHMPPTVVAGTTTSHDEGYGCEILTQRGHKESEQQTQYHSSSVDTLFLTSAAGYPGTPEMSSESGH